MSIGAYLPSFFVASATLRLRSQPRVLIIANEPLFIALMAASTAADVAYFISVCVFAALTIALTFLDIGTYGWISDDASSMAAGIALGLLPCYATTNSPSGFQIVLIILIVAAVPVVAPPIGSSAEAQGGAFPIGGLVIGMVAGAQRKRRNSGGKSPDGTAPPCDESDKKRRTKRSKKAMKAGGGTKAPTAPTPTATHPLRQPSMPVQRESANQKARESAKKYGNATAPGKKFMVFVDPDGEKCKPSDQGRLVTSHVDLFGKIVGFSEIETVASTHQKVQEAKKKFRADGTGKIKSWNQVNQRFGLFERFMMENDFEYGEWLKKLGALDGCNGEPTSFKVSESLIFSPIIFCGLQMRRTCRHLTREKFLHTYRIFEVMRGTPITPAGQSQTT